MSTSLDRAAAALSSSGASPARIASLTSAGLQMTDYPVLVDGLTSRLKAIYGDDLYLDPDSQDGQMLAVFAAAIMDTLNLAASVYNSFSPATAQGVSLSKQVVINGLRRKGTGNSNVTLRIIGTVGTVLNRAVARDKAEQKWLIPDGSIIPVSGELLVTAIAETEGDVRAAAGEITVIATPILGWHSVANPEAARVGRAVETDAELRRRQAISTSLPSKTVLEGIQGAVADLDGVGRTKAYENDTDTTDHRGIPPHHISLVVEGGDLDAIAKVIATKKGPGCGTFGDVAVAVRDRYGSPLAIRFWQPEDMPVTVKIVIRPLTGYLATTARQIITNVVEAINALGIGDPVLVSRLISVINAADADNRTFDVRADAVVISGTAANLTVAYNQVVSCAADAVTVEIDADV